MNTPSSDVWVRNLIESLGGTYVGIQHPLDPTDEHCVMFTRVNSTTLLSLPVSKVTHEAVKEKLGKNVTSFQKVENHINVDAMRSLAERLRDLTETVEAHIRWMEETK